MGANNFPKIKVIQRKKKIAVMMMIMVMTKFKIKKPKMNLNKLTLIPNHFRKDYKM